MNVVTFYLAGGVLGMAVVLVATCLEVWRSRR